jgi:hypothetical protein
LKDVKSLQFQFLIKFGNRTYNFAFHFAKL